MLRVALLICAGLVGACGQTTSVSQCIFNRGDIPLNTYIEGCETPPCQLPQLQDVVINIVFKVPQTMRTMTTLATAYVGLLPWNHPLQENAATCNFLTNSYCPVMGGEVLQYTLRMYIESWFPVGTSVPIEFRVVGDNNDPLFCIRVPITVAPPVDSA